MNWIITFLTAYFLAYLSVFTHEFMHAIVYQITYRSRDWVIRLGEGKKIGSVGRINFHIYPTTGYCKWNNYDSRNRYKNIVMLIVGPISSLVLVILIFTANRYVQIEDISSSIFNIEWVLGFGFWYNLYSFVFTLIPITYQTGLNKGSASDGLQILRLIKLRQF